MSEMKSKLPDFKEVTSMATKLFKDVKTSLTEIILEYKKKRSEEASAAKKTEAVKTQTAYPEDVVRKKEKIATEEKAPAPRKPRVKTVKKKEDSE